MNGWIKDPLAEGGKRAFIRHRNPSPTPELVNGGDVSTAATPATANFGEVFDGATPTQLENFDSLIDGGGVGG